MKTLGSLALAACVGFAFAAAQTPAEAQGFTDGAALFTEFNTNLQHNYTIGTASPGAGDCYPFSCFASETHPGPGNLYQQVWSAAAFPGVSDIFGVDFFQQQAGAMDTAIYNISWWLTPRAVDDLSDDAAANRGTFLINWGQFTLDGGMPLTLALGNNPFLYDPAQGNLLMQVQVVSLIFAHPYQSFFQVDTSGLTSSRYFDFGPGGPADVPEPASWALIIAGFGLAGAALRRRRTAAVA